MTSTDELVSELLRLPAQDRARVARTLLQSLDENSADPQAESEWAAELERRMRSIEDGSAVLVDGDEVRRRVQDRLRAMRERR